MAYVNSRSASVTVWDRFASVVKMVQEAAARRRVYNQTVQELSSLSNRDLTDLGLSRDQISEVAREAAYTR